MLRCVRSQTITRLRVRLVPSPTRLYCEKKKEFPFTLSDSHRIKVSESFADFTGEDTETDIEQENTTKQKAGMEFGESHFHPGQGTNPKRSKGGMECSDRSPLPTLDQDRKPFSSKGGMQFGDCSLPDQAAMEGESELEEIDERTHPIVQTGFEFRDYKGEGEGEEEGEQENIFREEANQNITTEEQEMLQIPEKEGKKKFPYVRRDFTKCRGCGIRLQSSAPLNLGYVPPPNIKKSKKKRRICQRCYYLRFYSKEPPQIEQNVQVKYETGLSADAVSGYLSEVLPSKSCVVLHVVDMSDISEDSFIPNVSKVIGTNPILFVGTKLDILPTGWKLHRLKQWLQKYALQFCGIKQLPMTHVHIVSSHSGQNIKSTMRNIDLFRKERDLYVIGAVNCGKSSFINSALLHVGIGGIKYDKKYGLTTSNLPGTTLDAISMPLKTGGNLHDTPGFQVQNLLPSLLAKERKILIPRKSIRPQILYMREGKSIILGGCARFDYVRGPPLYFAVFGSSTLPMHCTSIEGADRLFATKLGTYLSPPSIYSEVELKKEKKEAAEYTKKVFSYLFEGEKRMAAALSKQAAFATGGRVDTSEEQITTTDIEEPELVSEEHDKNQLNQDNEEPHREDEVQGEDKELQVVEEGYREEWEDQELQAVEEGDGEEVEEISEPAMADLIHQMNEQRPMPLPTEFIVSKFEFAEGGEDYDAAFADFVFPGIGWISATGKSRETLLFNAYGFSKPYDRNPIMPLEANRDSRKASGYKKHGKLANYKYDVDSFNKE